VADGVGVADAAAGEIACAVLRLRPGAAKPTLGELGEHLTARGLSRRKLPERLEVVDDFPRTASGKIVKRALRERLGSG
jgi:non-ribosomal peptide synthetase component E (peptide arylation enzyme)